MLIHTGSHTVTTKTQHSKANTQMCTYMKYVYTYVIYVHIHKLRQANREKHKKRTHKLTCIHTMKSIQRAETTNATPTDTNTTPPPITLVTVSKSV